MSDDARWLAAAASLAARARPCSRPNPAVGAIVVKDGRAVGRGWTGRGGRPHAEAVALEQAGSAAQGAALFVTLEPCAHESQRGPACANLVAGSDDIFANRIELFRSKGRQRTSHVTADGKHSFCEFEAPNEEACREHAQLAGLPVDDVIAVNPEIGPEQFK